MEEILHLGGVSYPVKKGMNYLPQLPGSPDLVHQQYVPCIEFLAICGLTVW